MRVFLITILFFSTCFNSFGQNKESLEQDSVKLRKGYTLVFKQTDSVDYVLLRNKRETKQLASFTHRVLFNWLELDGNNCFMVGYGTHGSGNPVELDIYKKDLGLIVYSASAYILYTDTLKSTIVCDDQGKNKGSFILYDLFKNKYNLFKEPEDKGCDEDYDCWEVVSLTNTELKIKYQDTLKKERIITYKIDPNGNEIK